MKSTDSELKERKNPFKVMFDNAAAKLRLQDNTVELKYLPFTNNMHKFSWTPDVHFFFSPYFHFLSFINVPPSHFLL